MTPVGNLPRSDADLAAALAMSVVRLARRLRSEGIDDLGVGVGAVAVLALLHREGERTVGELARLERVRPPSMTRTVARLETSGYVERFAHPTDGRQVLVRLSDKGRELLAAERRRRDAWLARHLRNLTAEERALLRQTASIFDSLACAGDAS